MKLVGRWRRGDNGPHQPSMAQDIRKHRRLCAQLWTREGSARGWSRASAGGSAGGASDGARLQAARGAAQLFLGMHGEGRHARLADFDDHLNDLSKCAPSCTSEHVRTNLQGRLVGKIRRPRGRVGWLG